MDPLISIRILRPERVFAPHENLACEYQIDAVEANDIAAVEASVMWFTVGKGDEDLSVHYFERRTPGDIVDGDLRVLRRFECQLPNSPLSYDGFMVKICWCVRVRVFLKGGRDFAQDVPFRIGSVPHVQFTPPAVETETAAN